MNDTIDTNETIDKSNFEQLLEAGKFTVTAEIGPPMSANADFVRKRARELKGYVDAAYVTDNQTAMVRMSSIAAAGCGCVQALIAPCFPARGRGS